MSQARAESLCGQCRYDLTGVRGSPDGVRCPECGGVNLPVEAVPRRTSLRLSGLAAFAIFMASLFAMGVAPWVAGLAAFGPIIAIAWWRGHPRRQSRGRIASEREPTNDGA